LLASPRNFTGIIQNITAIRPASRMEEDRLTSLMEKEAKPFEEGGNSCSMCGRRLTIQDYLGHYDVLFHVKGYECPGCGHRFIDRSPLKELKYQSGGWIWVERMTRLSIQKWNPAKIPGGKAGSRA